MYSTFHAVFVIHALLTCNFQSYSFFLCKVGYLYSNYTVSIATEQCFTLKILVTIFFQFLILKSLRAGNITFTRTTIWLTTLLLLNSLYIQISNFDYFFFWTIYFYFFLCFSLSFVFSFLYLLSFCLFSHSLCPSDQLATWSP